MISLQTQVVVTRDCFNKYIAIVQIVIDAILLLLPQTADNLTPIATTTKMRSYNVGNTINTNTNANAIDTVTSNGCMNAINNNRQCYNNVNTFDTNNGQTNNISANNNTIAAANINGAVANQMLGNQLQPQHLNNHQHQINTQYMFPASLNGTLVPETVTATMMTAAALTAVARATQSSLQVSSPQQQPPPLHPMPTATPMPQSTASGSLNSMVPQMSSNAVTASNEIISLTSTPSSSSASSVSGTSDEISSGAPITAGDEIYDVTRWLFKYRRPLTVIEVCHLMGIDLLQKNNNNLFWELTIDSRVILEEKLLDYIEFNVGLNYYKRKEGITKLLRQPENEHIQTEEVSDPDDLRKKYYVISGLDFNTLLMQMRTNKARELCRLMVLIKTALIKQSEYEQLYLQYNASWRNYTDVQLEMCLDEIRKCRQAKATLYHHKFITNERFQNHQRIKHQMQHQLLRSRKRQLDQRPPALGLYRTNNAGEWYLMRRKMEYWNNAERKVLKRGMEKIFCWFNTDHTTNVMASLCDRFDQYDWTIYGNYIRSPEFAAKFGENADKQLRDIITSIIEHDLNHHAKQLFDQWPQHNQMDMQEQLVPESEQAPC